MDDEIYVYQIGQDTQNSHREFWVLPTTKIAQFESDRGGLMHGEQRMLVHEPYTSWVERTDLDLDPDS